MSGPADLSGANARAEVDLLKLQQKLGYMARRDVEAVLRELAQLPFHTRSNLIHYAAGR